MDLNYDISTWEFSLQTMCAAVVCQEILEKTRHELGPALNASDLDYVSKDREMARFAAEKIDKLKLPPAAAAMLKNMLRPILDELNNWYELLPLGMRPILTPQGTIDLKKSTRAAIQQDKEGVFLYVLNLNVNVYDFSSSRVLLVPSQVFQDIGPQGERHLVIPGSMNIPPFWYDVYNGQFDGQLDCEDLTEEEYEECEEDFDNLLHSYQSINIKYFIDMLPPSHIKERLLFYKQELNWFWSFSPTVTTLLFSRMMEDQQTLVKPAFSSRLLGYLIDWPFQRTFLEAAKTLIKNLDKDQFWHLLKCILKKLRNGYRDCDYAGIFVGFWHLGIEHTNVSYMKTMDETKWTLNEVLKVRDERILDVVLGNMSVEDKMCFLREFHNNGLCRQLIREKDCHALEILIRVCGMNRSDLLMNFRKYLLAHIPQFWNVRELMPVYNQIANITDRIISEALL